MSHNKEKYIEKKGIFGNAVDYRVYHMSIKEKLIGAIMYGAISFAAVQIFFGNMILSCICAFIVGFFGINIYKKTLNKKREENLIRQFRDMLEALSTSLGSGKNTTEAFIDVASDMVNQYGEGAYIVNELNHINLGIQNNIMLEALLKDFADRSHLEDIENFADVFMVANRTGGNIRDIVFETKNVISEKISTEFEIQTLISGKKNEMNIMIVLPFIVVSQIQGIQTQNVSKESLIITFVVKLIALAMIAGAYVLGKKIMDISM